MLFSLELLSTLHCIPKMKLIGMSENYHAVHNTILVTVSVKNFSI